ncbi:MAG: hypothetical protein P8020_14575 [Acidobacteriota bacterium]|jgi:hypothetical protein
MNEFRWTRLILAGLAAGAVLLAGETILNSFVLGIEWQQVLLRLRVAPLSGPVAALLVSDTFLLGVFQAWLIGRLRRTAGVAMPRVVLEAAFIVWLTVFLFTGTWLTLLGIVSPRLMLFSSLWGLGECVLSSLIAAWILTRR